MYSATWGFPKMVVPNNYRLLVFLLKMTVLGCFGGTTILGNTHMQPCQTHKGHHPLRTLTRFWFGGQRHCFGLWIVELSQNLPKQREKEFLAHRSATTAVLSLQYASTKLQQNWKNDEKYVLRYTGDVTPNLTCIATQKL